MSSPLPHKLGQPSHQGHVFRQLCRQGSVELVDEMLKAGMSIDLPQEDGCTGLWLACENGCVEVVKLLAQKRANVNAVKTVGNISALYIACQNGHPEVVDVLLIHGANPNLCKNTGAGPLFIAAQQNYPDMVRSLIKAGANFNAVTQQGISALMIAAYFGHTNCVKALLGAGADPYAQGQGRNMIEWAQSGGHRNEVQACLEQHMRMLEAERRRRQEQAMYSDGGPVVSAQKQQQAMTPSNDYSGGGATTPRGGGGGTPNNNYNNNNTTGGFSSSRFLNNSSRNVADSFGGYTPQYLTAGSNAANRSYSVYSGAGGGSYATRPNLGAGRSSPDRARSPAASSRRHYNTRSFQGSTLDPGVGEMSHAYYGITPQVLIEEERRNNAFRSMIRRDTNASQRRSRSIASTLHDPAPSSGAKLTKRDTYSTNQEWELHKERLSALEDHASYTKGQVADSWMYSVSATTQYAQQMRDIHSQMQDAQQYNKEQSEQQHGETSGFALPRLPPGKIQELHRFMAVGRGATGPPPPLPPEEPLPEPSAAASTASPTDFGGGSSMFGSPAATPAPISTTAPSGLTSAAPEPSSPPKKLTAMERLALKKAGRA